MTRRALLIGAETGGLTGVGPDVETMSALLGKRGFEIDRREGADATRAGILDGYERLISATGAGDAAVVYYSGHGGYARSAAVNPATAARLGVANPLPDMQFIVPTDYEESVDADFRGVTAVELSALLARLTDRTRNATVVLDCCHAAHMSRDPDLLPKARVRPTYLDLAAHLGRLRAAGLDIGRADLIGNRHAVRVVACAPWESAYEYTNRDGVRTGLFTESLRVALDEAGELPVNWVTVLRQVRARVARTTTGQRPEAEGSAKRLLFDVREVDQAGVLPVTSAGANRVAIPGGRLLGLAIRDEFVLMPAGAAEVSAATQIGIAVVDEVTSIAATAAVTFQPGQVEVPVGTQAHPVRIGGRRHPVAVRGAGAIADLMRAAVAAAPQLRLGDVDDQFLLAEVKIGRLLQVRDGGGPLHAPRPADEAGVRTAVEDLARLARAATVRALEPDVAELLTEPFTVEWGRVVDGERRPLRPTAELVPNGEPVYLRLRNDSERNLFFHVFDIGVAGRIELITASDQAGLRLEPHQETVLGANQAGALDGLNLHWPAELPADGPRAESLLVIVTAAPQELSVLRQEGVGGQPAAQTRSLLSHGSTLEQLLTQVAVGGMRDLTATRRTATVRYAVRHLDFLLNPAPGPIEETAPFLIDERPEASVRVLGGRGVPASTAAVAVRIRELVVHSNRAMGGADLRVDAVVLTGGAGDEPVYRAQTARFDNIHDGDRLPLDNLLVYRGAVVDYLDLAVWVSRDGADSPHLSELLGQQLKTDEFHQAAPHLAALTVAAPRVAVAAAALGAGAAIINTAHRSLSAAVGNSVGLYRTSLLPTEAFGVGRHPGSGLLRAPDFSFSYDVIAV